MHHLKARNVHRMAPTLLAYMMKNAKGSEHPTGPRLMLDGVTVVELERPQERVILHDELGTNPFFMTMRAMWAMAGRTDSAFLATYDKNIPELVACPGWRWRAAFELDQLQIAVEHIRDQPMLQVWSTQDTQLTSVERNLTACFRRTVDNTLNLVVYCGPMNVMEHLLEEDAYTYSLALEFVARATGCDIGGLTFVSTCLWMAATPVNLNITDSLEHVQDQLCQYETQGWDTFPVMKNPNTGEGWMKDLDMMLSNGPSPMGVNEQYFRRVIAPLMAAWDAFIRRDTGPALALCHEIQDKALATACRNYLDAIRVAEARMEKKR